MATLPAAKDEGTLYTSSSFLKVPDRLLIVKNSRSLLVKVTVPVFLALNTLFNVQYQLVRLTAPFDCLA